MPPDLPLSNVEQRALAASPFDALYPPTEQIGTLMVEHFPALGKLAAMRFLEWVQDHPGGVVSLPTGKTPEHFIHWVTRMLGTWDQADTQTLLEESGVDPARKPDMQSLHFVQIDEFYPIRPWQQNSFIYYVRKYYLEGFGLDPDKAMLIDCERVGLDRPEDLEAIWPDRTVDLSLRLRAGTTALERQQKDALARIDQWCQAYEDRIRALGGIGFFLGGIGPDGHIGFNVRGSDHRSTTRLTATNYETQAAAAQDLGGIEVSRKRLVITVGLGTITCNPDCAAVIIAAGEAKAGVVADAVEQQPHVRYPATALHALPHARFYVTRGAAKLLKERQYERLARADEISSEDARRAIVDLAVARHKPIADLPEADVGADRFAACVQERSGTAAAALCEEIHEHLASAIARGAHVLTGTRFLHTEPHHDDIMLGYLASVVRHGRDPANTHHFACMTSGFTAVTNQYLLRKLAQLRDWIDTPAFEALRAEDYFRPDNDKGRQRDVWQFLDGVAGKNAAMMAEAEARRQLRDLVTVFEEQAFGSIKNRAHEVIHYLESEYPGKKDPEYIQDLKGMCREWEAECLWGYFGWGCSNVHHLRLGFYTGDIFTEEPTLERDVPPILETLERVRPDIVTVALDPEGSGPDTHYKVLQALAEAVHQYAERNKPERLRIWGYRNVWYRFHPAEANLFVPVSLNMFSILERAFLNTFGSQREASFPSYEHDGPFCELARKIQVEQYQQLKTCLGRQWFHEHEMNMIRATRGLVFLREMELEEFYDVSRELRKNTEAR